VLFFHREYLVFNEFSELSGSGTAEIEGEISVLKHHFHPAAMELPAGQVVSVNNQ
jgi:hypothetical protein